MPVTKWFWPSHIILILFYILARFQSKRHSFRAKVGSKTEGKGILFCSNITQLDTVCSTPQC